VRQEISMSNPIHNSKIQELIQTQVQPRPTTVAPQDRTAFQELLQDKLKLSGHAQTRLQSRNIELDKQQWERVLDGVQRAADKGAKESLVMIDDIALVVSVKNRTVITAVDQAHLKENVFTNIDSAVIV
jgi:flagellar operon protein